MEYKLWKQTTFIFKRTPLDIRNKHHLVLPKQTETISKKLNNSLQEFMSRFHFNCSQFNNLKIANHQFHNHLLILLNDFQRKANVQSCYEKVVKNSVTKVTFNKFT